MEFFFGTKLLSVNSSKEALFEIFDKAFGLGINGFETAPNYPALNNMEFFRYFEDILHEWLVSTQKQTDIIVRPGIVDNNTEPKFNNNFSFLVMSTTHYIDKFGDNLKMVLMNEITEIEEDYLASYIDTAQVLSKNMEVAVPTAKIEVFSIFAAKNEFYPNWYIPITEYELAEQYINKDAYVEIDIQHNNDLDTLLNKLNYKMKGIIIQAETIEQFEDILTKCRNRLRISK